jgi:putative nucleotidyltransferase with HDIG domain
MIATLATVGFILAAVFVVLTLAVRATVRGTVADRLNTGQRILSALEQRRGRELQEQVATLAENPTLKAAIDTYHSELRLDESVPNRELLDTVEREVDKLVERIHPDVIAVTNPSGSIVAVGGRKRADWPREGPSRWLSRDGPDEFVALSGAGTVIVSRGTIIASTLPTAATRLLTPSFVATFADADTVDLAGEQYAVKLLFKHGDAAVYALDSIDKSAAPLVSAALRATLLLALGSLVLAGVASVWLARTVARPIDTLSRSLSAMTRSKDFGSPVQTTGSSLEVDTLTQTFNAMMASVIAAQADTRSAYVGAIRALALALDARDPYTAGHSERVSAISVAMGQRMSLPEEQLDVLRLGALLHDIGKIGISDQVLLKPGALTPEEFEQIKTHPVVGARILRTVPFLERHLAIVELHHERPDGKGYPHGLRGDEIPILARIVHVADAFDAITSARAYRPARGAAEGLQELWRHAGSQFDAEAVQALAGTIPTLRLHENRIERTAARAAHKTPLVAVSRS